MASGKSLASTQVDVVGARCSRQGKTLRRWLWLSYLKAAVVPLLFIELTFVGIFLLTNSLVHDRNVDALRGASQSYLDDVVRLEAKNIAQTLNSVARSTDLLAKRTRQALDLNHAVSKAEISRYGWTEYGAYYTKYDIGTTASYFSGAVPITPDKVKKVRQLASVDPLMIDLAKTDPLVASVYINTHDSYNRIYPYFNVLEQYPKKMRIPDYNFFYLADADHNPQRKAVWTQAYVDPAGHGWMISSIAPVWRNNTLEAVVGQDITLTDIIHRLRNLKLPWSAYAMLVDRNGHIIAMPPQGERDLGIKELTNFDYQKAVLTDTTKPERFNLAARSDTRALSLALQTAERGRLRLNLNGMSVASFHRIPGPEWRLVVVASESNIFAQADSLRDQLRLVAGGMVGILIAFYLAFFYFLYRRAAIMSLGLSKPVNTLAALFQAIGAGKYVHAAPPSNIVEIDDLGRQVVVTSTQLEAANQTILAQEAATSRALRAERQAKEEQLRFIRVLSHELRTPLAVIDSGAQILARKADAVGPDEVRQRAERFRKAVGRIGRLTDKLVQNTQMSEKVDVVATVTKEADLGSAIKIVGNELVAAERLHLRVPPAPVVIGDEPSATFALRVVLDNALRYGDTVAPISIDLDVEGDQACIKVSNRDSHLTEDEMARFGERFYRGTNAADHEGAGLGLHLARKVVEAAGGSLGLTKEAEWTVAEIRLPLFPRPVRM